jgi:hypothetical protein
VIECVRVRDESSGPASSWLLVKRAAGVPDPDRTRLACLSGVGIAAGLHAERRSRDSAADGATSRCGPPPPVWPAVQTLRLSDIRVRVRGC